VDTLQISSQGITVPPAITVSTATSTSGTTP